MEIQGEKWQREGFVALAGANKLQRNHRSVIFNPGNGTARILPIRDSLSNFLLQSPS
jgi:hypothetical protein